MKRLQIFLPFLALLPVLATASHPSTPLGTLQVKVDTMEVRGDSMFLSMKMIQHGQAVSAKRSLTLTPVFSDSGHVCELPSVLINGKCRQRASKVSKFLHPKKQTPYYKVLVAGTKSQDTLHYAVRVPHEEWMDGAKVTLRQKDARGSKTYSTRKVEFANWPLSSIYSAERLITQESYVLPSPEGVKRRSTTGKAYLDFRQNQWLIDMDYRNNRREMQRIYASISTLENNPDIRMTGFHIVGYTSPEEAAQTNKNLSAKRALSLKNTIQNFFKLDSTLFQVEGKGENWDGLMQLLQSSDGAQSDSVFSQISGFSLKEKRQEMLAQLANGASYKELQNKLFPDLRKVEYQISYVVRDYSFEESKVIYSNTANNLSQIELFLIAESFGRNSPAFDVIIGKIHQFFPEDTTANINAAAVMLRRGETGMAGRSLMKCLQCPTTYNNLGAYYMQVGDLTKAEDYLRKAVALGTPQADRNLMVLRAKKKMIQLKIQKGL